MILYNTQNDDRWKNEVMTGPGYSNGNEQKYADYLGMAGSVPAGDRIRFAIGCVVTSLANAIQLIEGTEYTPKELNDYLKSNKGYAYLMNGSSTKSGTESYVLWDKVVDRFDRISAIDKVATRDYDEKYCNHYIAYFKYYGSNHYSNVIGMTLIKGDRYFIIYNVWDGKLQILPESDIKHFRRIICVKG